jgi:hypothetical protein
VQFLETLDADRAWALRKALLRSPSPGPGGNPGSSMLRQARPKIAQFQPKRVPVRVTKMRQN